MPDPDTVALWIGWAVMVSAGVMAAAALVTLIPYLVLDQCWKVLKVEKDFVQIAVRYYKEKKK